MSPPDDLARRWNARLKNDGLSAKTNSVRDDRAMSGKHTAAEARRMRELRRRPSYLAIEGQQASADEARLIRADESALPAPKLVIEEAPKPSFAEMRAKMNDFPPKPPNAVRKLTAGRREKRSSKPSAVRD